SILASGIRKFAVLVCGSVAVVQRPSLRKNRAGQGRTGITRQFTLWRLGMVTVDEERRDAKKILDNVARAQDPS
ncbi:MAG: hypothetical protein ABL898_11410, partial [Hyphomicrobiaceae bacterium]